MIRNYITVALRVLMKNKVFSFINILGLSTGIACCILITLYIQDEFVYEKGFTDHEKIFRINTTFINEDKVEKSGTTSPPIAPGLAQAIPDISIATRILKHPGIEQHIVRYEDKTFFEEKAILVDSSFLDVFQYELKEGDRKTALDLPSSILLSEKLAFKIFGDKPALDELLIVNSGTNADTFRITGVLASPKYPSHLDANMYMSMNSNGWGSWVLAQTTWANNNMIGGYVKLNDPAKYKEVESLFPQFMEMHAGEELRMSGRQKILTLQALDDIRLYSDLTGANASSGITYIYIMGTIAVMILLLGCINFMNLTTAKSAQRAGEVGIRKSMGAYKGNLIGQFLGESSIIVLISMIFAFIIVMLTLPFFNGLMQKELSFNISNLPFILTATTLIGIFTALIAGSYPAFYLSSMRPTEVLKSKNLSGDSSQWLRKGLVVAQFVITITLISSIVIIQKQLSFIQSKGLGFDTEQVIMIPMRTLQASEQYDNLKQSFSQLAGVKEISATNSLPSTPHFTDWSVFKDGATSDQALRHDIIRVDKDYFNVLGVELIAGRDFIREQDNLPTDTVNNPKIIVNEASLKELGIPLDEAIGANIHFQPADTRYTFTVIGVVRDFHQFSLHRQIGPMMFILSGNRNYFPYIAASIDINSYGTLKEQMKEYWDSRISDAPFEHVFLNENIKTLYKQEARTSTVLTISTIIALIISSLGLYGLSVYIAERKTKEIGIRKVVGASAGWIIGMLSKEYIKLILIAFIISVPLGYYAMDQWLKGFAYKIDPGIAVFLISGIVSFVIAWTTVSFESFRAANRNPVDILKNS